jgi:hypothetical protein
MAILESSIVHTVNEASERMSDPEYVSNQVDMFIAAQPMMAQYVLAYRDDLKDEGLVNLLFHAALIHMSIAHGTGKTLPLITIQVLDRAIKRAPGLEDLATIEPHLASFIVSNIDEEKKLARKLLTHITIALSSVS